ncbi:MAG: VWA domain-containing protein [Myxococcaceae bacterium]|nr:VWA domain-containing protein [Myxococcaceae bacterium]
MKLLSRAAAVLLSLFALTASAATPAAEEMKPPPRVQIALLLDNSGSMQGLINQARTQMWKLVNEFATAKQNGKPIRLELALYEYGDKPTRLSPFTTNLDKVSEQLFGLGIRGGDEYCGTVIQKATQELEWSGNADDLKLIYIAGNEEFTQGPVSPEAAISAAKKKGIVVNVIHADSGSDPTWSAGAKLAGTPLMQINHNAAVAQVVAPQDQRLAELSNKLNGTYIGYGAQGGSGVARQAAMDEAAQKAAPAALAERVVSKSTANYKNDDWDLVDAKKEGKVSLGKMKQEELPAEMKGMNEQQREAFVAKKAEERAQIQKEIADLSKQRAEYVAKQEAAKPAESTLDKAMIDSVRTSAAAKSISLH